MKETKLDFKNSKGQRLVGILFSPNIDGDYPVVIYCHGYRSTKESSKVKPIAEKLAENNISLFAFDFDGRGESEGKFEDTTITQYIDDLKCAIDFISERTDRIGVVGNSLGGLIALQEAVNDKRVQTLALLAPVSIFPYKTHNKEFTPEGVKEWKKKGYTYTQSGRFGKLKINYTYYQDISKYNNYSVYDNINIPVLIIHGTGDDGVGFEYSEELVKHLSVHQFIPIEGDDHNFTQNKQLMVDETCNFLKKTLK